VTGRDLPAELGSTVRAALELDTPLKERLAALADRTRTQHPDFAAAIDRLVTRLRESGAGSTVPGPGDLMPPFLLPDDRGRLTRLHDIIADGPAAVCFHRGHWCPFCRTNISALAKAQHEIMALGARIVAITPDRAIYGAQLRALSGATFPILTDLDNGYALSLDLAIWLDREMQGFVRERGHDLPRFQGNASWMVPIPATFVVRKDGVIGARYLDPDYRQRMSIEDLIEALKQAR
jgi:peroxiredoxin